MALPLAAARGGSSPGVAIQRNGQIVVAGAAPAATGAVGAAPPGRARVVRLHPDGTLDARFGDGGFTERPIPGAEGPSRAVRVALDSVERIHVVVSCDPLEGYSPLRCAARSWRLLADGQPDAGFAESAIPVPIEGGAYPLAIATMVDGSSFVLMEEPFDIMDNSERLVRILADGSVDRAFANPILTRQIQAILAWDGGLYVSQLVETSNGVRHGAIVRLDSQGAPDRSFGAQGSLRLASVPVLGDSPTYLVALAGDGPHSLIASGAALPTTLAPPDTLITRVTDQGAAAIDSAFGREGFARLGLGLAFYNGQAVRRDASGRLIVAGLTSTRVATGLPRAARLSETAATPGDSPGVFGLLDNGASLRESGGVLRLYVTRSGGARGPASLEYETVSGSAVEGSDFLATRGRLDWADGDSSEKEVQVRLIDDAVAEPPESFWLALRNPVGARLLANEAVWIDVLDDDAAGARREAVRQPPAACQPPPPPLAQAAGVAVAAARPGRRCSGCLVPGSWRDSVALLAAPVSERRSPSASPR